MSTHQSAKVDELWQIVANVGKMRPNLVYAFMDKTVGLGIGGANCSTLHVHVARIVLNLTSSWRCESFKLLRSPTECHLWPPRWWKKCHFH